MQSRANQYVVDVCVLQLRSENLSDLTCINPNDRDTLIVFDS